MMMDRRSWLWRRKSEKSPTGGEGESSGGSISSHSERLSDDQAVSYHNPQFPEVTSKASHNEDELNETVKALTEKLSEALLKIQAKEELVKQHAKVAEEAVSGWEKAETEARALKKQIESLTQKNSVLEERMGHLDGALKECLRQLRQVKEEQEQKISRAVSEKGSEWESIKSKLENQLHDLQSQLQTATTEASMVSGLRAKLQASEKENSALMLQLHSRTEELELRTRERDLSTHTAETASKQHLESIKKVTKLEAECRRLKAATCRAARANDHRCWGTASSIYVESFADSQSDSGDRLSVIGTESCRMSGAKNHDCKQRNSGSRTSAVMAELDQLKKEKPLGRSLMAASVEINLMDDFLEMERLAALPEMESRSRCDGGAHSIEQTLRAELEAMINRTAELEEKLETIEAEKTKLEVTLVECQNQIHTSRNKLEETELKLEELTAELLVEIEKKKAAESAIESTNVKLKESMAHLEEMEAKLVELQTQLATASEEKQMAEMELETTSKKKNIAETQLIAKELELQTLLSKIGILEEEVQKERALSNEAVTRCQKLETEISRVKHGSQLQEAANIVELKANQDKELQMASHKFAECQKTIASITRQLKSLATIEDFLIDS